ncbi:hypothetical protein SAMN06295924_105212, partial [Rathayibacter rathayi NCPPB 2980 = VKM Ac-1601]
MAAPAPLPLPLPLPLVSREMPLMTP